MEIILGVERIPFSYLELIYVCELFDGLEVPNYPTMTYLYIFLYILFVYKMSFPTYRTGVVPVLVSCLQSSRLVHELVQQYLLITKRHKSG